MAALASSLPTRRAVTRPFQALLFTVLLKAAFPFQVQTLGGKVLKRPPFSPSVWPSADNTLSNVASSGRSAHVLRRKRGKGDEDLMDDDEDIEEEPVFRQASPLLQETSRTLRRVSWFSWWSQVILTTISGVILVFARNVLGGRSAREAAVGASDPSFFLSGLGLVTSGISILWTWGNGARLSRRLTRRPVSRTQAANMLRRAVRVGVSLNLVGLLVHLLAAEEIVGSLAIKVLTSSRQLQGSAYFTAMEGLQPLDVLIVQANTNQLLSHFCSLASLLFLSQDITKLDPPSTEGAKQRG